MQGSVLAYFPAEVGPPYFPAECTPGVAGRARGVEQFLSAGTTAATTAGGGQLKQGPQGPQGPAESREGGAGGSGSRIDGAVSGGSHLGAAASV